MRLGCVFSGLDDTGEIRQRRNIDDRIWPAISSIRPGDKVEFTLEVAEGGTGIISEMKKR
jgi:hypothetical protein